MHTCDTKTGYKLFSQIINVNVDPSVEFIIVDVKTINVYIFLFIRVIRI